MTTLHQASVPVFEQFLHTLSAQVDKLSAFAASRKIADADALGWRLYPDMLPLLAQFLIACDAGLHSQRSGGRRQRGREARAAHSGWPGRQSADVGRRLFLSSRAAKFLFSCRDGARHPAAQWRRDRQTRFLRRRAERHARLTRIHTEH
jgi:hypothetical protein